MFADFVWSRRCAAGGGERATLRARPYRRASTRASKSSFSFCLRLCLRLNDAAFAAFAACHSKTSTTGFMSSQVRVKVKVKVMV